MTNRWYQLGLKAPKAEKKSRNKKKKNLKISEGGDDSDDESSDEDDSSDDEEDEEILNMKRIERENENSFGYIDDDGYVLNVTSPFTTLLYSPFTLFVLIYQEIECR